MKSQTQHIGNYSNVFDYSPFGAPLDGRTLQNTFYQEAITTDTITETAYALEETFATSSNWSTTTSNSQISCPLGKMRVKNNASTKKTIGTRKSFTTGSGLHQLRFTISYLPNTLEFKIEDLNIKDNNLYQVIKNIYLTYSKELIDESGGEIIRKPMSLLNKADFERQLKDILKAQNKKFKKEYLSALYEELKETEISLDINDGFIGELFNTKPSIDNYTQNVFFLHGSFHIYKDKKSIYKITKTQDKALYERLDEIIGDENKEIVSVFTNDSKALEIEENEYLVKGIEKLRNINGSLVIIGSSLAENDEHIFNALNESLVTKVFYASNDKGKTSDHNRLIELFPNKEIILFDRDTISYEKQEV